VAAAMINRRDLFIKSYFSKLKNANIKYAVLRNYEGIFKDKGKDIDILMNPDSYKIASKLFSEVCNEFSGNVLLSNISNKNLYLKTLIADDDTQSIKSVYVHIAAFITIKRNRQELSKKHVGLKSFIGDFELIEVEIDGFSFTVPEPKIQLLYMLSKFIQKETYRHIVSSQRIVKINHIENYLDNFDSNFMEMGNDIEIDMNFIYFLINDLLNLTTIETRPSFEKIKFLSVLFILNIKQLFRLSGIIVFFSGPDGSGKTTSNNALTELLVNELKIKVVNFKHLYPLSSLTGRQAQRLQARIRKVNLIDKDTLERDRGKGFKWKTRRFVGLIYALIQIWPGYLYGRYLNYRGYTVIVDTSFFDIFVKGHRPKFPMLQKAFAPFIPCGDKWFLMYAPAQEIVDRKPELTKEEIEDYYCKIKFIEKLSKSKPTQIATNLGTANALFQMIKKT
jgi:hypothetical protein